MIPVAMMPALIQGGLGLAQTVIGGLGLAKARKAAEKAARPDVGIMDYYNKALARYSANPYQSSYYQQMQNQIGRGLATGISATQTRRGGLSTITGLVQGATDQQARAAAQAEQMGRQDLGTLRDAARLAGSERDKYNNLMLQRYAQKSGLFNTGISNIMKGASTAAYQMGESSLGRGGSYGGKGTMTADQIIQTGNRADRSTNRFFENFRKRGGFNPNITADYQAGQPDD